MKNNIEHQESDNSTNEHPISVGQNPGGGDATEGNQKPQADDGENDLIIPAGELSAQVSPQMTDLNDLLVTEEERGSFSVLRAEPWTKATVAIPTRIGYFRASSDKAFSFVIRGVKVDFRKHKSVKNPFLFFGAKMAPHVGKHNIFEVVLCVNTNSEYFWAPFKYSDGNQQSDSWSASAMDALENARKSWIKMDSVQNQCYTFRVAETDFAEKPWPPREKAAELFQKALSMILIENIDHEYIQRGRGLIP